MINNYKERSLFKTYKKDFAYCEKIIQKHSKTFYAAFSSLPKEKAMSVYAVYAFCRKADDLVDEEFNMDGLIQLEEELRLFEKGQEVDHPIWRALRVVFSTYNMDINPFYDMITGQKMDLDFEQPTTQEELEEYSYFVAGTVGLMLLPLLSETPEKIQEEAIALGKGMQITNILRDVGEDLENGRVYLPTEVMEKFSLSRDMLEQHSINQAFIDMWEYEAKRAEDFYELCSGLFPYINEDAKKPLLLSLLFYREILDAVRMNDYQCFTKKNSVSTIRKVELLKIAERKLKN